MRTASMTLIAIMILLLIVTLLQFQLTSMNVEVRTNDSISHDYQIRINEFKKMPK